MDNVDLRRYTEDLKRKRLLVQEKIRGLEAELIDIDQKINTAETLHEDFCREYDLPLPALAVNPRLQQKFANLSIKEMLILIAHESQGVLDISEAKRILLKAGVFQSDRNAVTSMSPILSRHDDIFQRTSRGTYRLAIENLNEKELSLIALPKPSNTSSGVHVRFSNPGKMSLKFGNSIEVSKSDEQAKETDQHVSRAFNSLRELDGHHEEECRNRLLLQFNQLPSDVKMKARDLYVNRFGKQPFPFRKNEKSS